MKNSADLGCYPPRPLASVDNTLLDLQNSLYPTKAKFNKYFIMYSKYFPVLSLVQSTCNQWIGGVLHRLLIMC